MSVDQRTASPTVAGPSTRAPGRTGDDTRRSRIIVVGVLTVVAVYFLVPVYWLLVSSTKTTGDLFGSFGFWFADFELIDNISRLFSYNDGIYIRWVFNSILYAFVGATASTLLSAMAGYALAKFEFRGREALFGAILAGVLIPGTALALPLYFLFSEVGLSNTYWSVLLPSMISPFGVFLCRIYATAAVPDELLEAARIDGAGELRIFTSIALRAMTPVLVTVFLFELVGIWNNYILPLVMLSDTDLYPITLGLSTWNSAAERAPELYQLTVGGAMVSVVPLMIAMIVLQRFWRMDLTQGSVKQ